MDEEQNLNQDISEEHKKRNGKKKAHKKHKERSMAKAWIIAVAVVLVLVLAVVALVSYLRVRELKTTAATVNGEKITYAELDAQFDRLPSFYKLFYSKRQILDQLIDEKVLMQEAKKQGIVVQDKEVQSFLDDIMKQSMMNKSQFEQALKEKNLTLEELKTFYKNQLTITKLLNQTILSKITLSDEELQAYYEKNRDQFDKVEVEHILVNSSETAEFILSKLNSGSNFEDLAKEYSLDSSASAGGYLGWIKRGDTVPAFENAAFTVEKGQLSGVVKTQFGFHIIKVLDRKVAFEDSRDVVDFKAKVESQKGAFQNYTDALRKKAQIFVYLNDTGPKLEVVPENETNATKEPDNVVVLNNKTVVDVTPTTEVTTTIEEVQAAKACNERYDVPKEAVIYSSADQCTRCTAMDPIVQSVAKDYTIFNAQKGKDTGKVVSDCFPSVSLSIVPQFICVANGEILQGTQTEASLRQFAADCK